MGPKPKQQPKVEPPPEEEKPEESPVEEAEPADPKSLETGHSLILVEDDIVAIWEASEATRMGLLESKMVVEASDEFRKEIEMQLYYYHGHVAQFICPASYLTLIERCSDQRSDGLCLNARQTAVAHMIVKMLLDTIRSGLGTNSSGQVVRSLDKAAVVDKFRELALLYTVEHPVFSTAEMRLLADYLDMSFFAHFNLYMYTLIWPREIERIEISLPIQEPEGPPPLDEAIEVSERAEMSLETMQRRVERSVSAAQVDDTENRPENESSSSPVDGEAEKSFRITEVQELMESGMDEATAVAVHEKLAELAAAIEAKLADREKEIEERLQAVQG
ncbi:hypothetical protein FOL47_006489 [Perkinsus chesapeaki]|uniref:Uncharacterized protein n=1 Tax=Perkinsus chesapeaki TaxID=330153 RepID=A0A7J6LRQ6_PERCH|nr:hypothetical protein FOL47_006489 [Perkinsus chesapeaki]